MRQVRTLKLPLAQAALERALLFWLAVQARQAQHLAVDWPAVEANLGQLEHRGLLPRPLGLARQGARYSSQVAMVINVDAPATEGTDRVRWLEEALRNLSEYAFLGEHPLARWKLVERRLPKGSRTTLDRGKVLYEVLVEAIEKFRPAGKRPVDFPPKVWHAYLILHEAYVENVDNRDIMSQLNLSEGTFNRRRRAALKALAQLLEDMEAA